jgi:hypothetical protein
VTRIFYSKLKLGEELAKEEKQLLATVQEAMNAVLSNKVRVFGIGSRN